MKRDQHLRRRRPALRVYLLAAFALTILLGLSDDILAQSQWTTNGNDITNANPGNVGIGTNPDLTGQWTGFAKILSMQGSSQRSILELSNSATGTGGVAGQISFENGATYLGAILGVSEGATNSGYLSFWTNNAGAFSEKLRVNKAGNVGIGTNAPLGILHARSPTSTHANLLLDTTSVGYASYFSFYEAGQGRASIMHNPTVLAGGLLFQTGGLGSPASTRLAIDSVGNVGIGTVAPLYKLDVSGEINATGLRINGTPISTGSASAVISVFGRTGAVVAATNDYTWAQINKNTSSLADLTTRSAGDLSSGTLPDQRFPAILPAVSGANLTALNASNLASGTVPLARLGSGTADSTKFLRGDNTWAVPSGNSPWTTSNPNIYYNTGNVGIGTTNPQAKLDVQGNVSVMGNISTTGNITAKYQDVAEWVPSRQKLSAGTVVVLDPEQSNNVMASAIAYDMRVAGVVSAAPGVILGEGGEGKVMVATTGRVKVRVDATRAPIRIGDLLVTSDVPGVAMKSEPINIGGVHLHRPGTLIGKALEPLAKGDGEILVLLSLQ